MLLVVVAVALSSSLLAAVAIVVLGHGGRSSKVGDGACCSGCFWQWFRH